MVLYALHVIVSVGVGMCTWSYTCICMRVCGGQKPRSSVLPQLLSSFEPAPRPGQTTESCSFHTPPALEPHAQFYVYPGHLSLGHTWSAGTLQTEPFPKAKRDLLRWIWSPHMQSQHLGG